ncbi:MAG: GNAT family N-acetyltransferase [Anaeroplasmataceae bacterium]|nr:GNAT family N-acetyltransferase [Anaeroplasmataceae bacterium]
MVEIRRYQCKDKDQVRRICMETAKKGFQHKEVVCWMFLDYYLESEPEHSFVLVDEEEVVGYIVVSLDKDLYAKQMKEKWIPKIKKYSFILGWFSKICLRTTKPLDQKYSGGFHMNITASHQRQGYGRRLLDVMGKHLLLYDKPYLYLITENKRTRGHGFYKHYGFQVIKKYFGGALALCYKIK